LQQQYETLLDHFSDIDQLKRQAISNNANAQYKLAQSLQSHNLAEAMQWLQSAAINGNSNAQYELSVRMIRGKKNPPETTQDIKKWATAAATSGHVGAIIFIANQFKMGKSGFEKNSALSKQYYVQALQSTDADILFEGKIAGRSIRIKRSNIMNIVDALRNSKSTK
jgi:TPR repeat protein